ncbi:hypothetical protein [Streptodolium elevatio]|uniref:Uncharacterized protein n=1 Tax=Streptodolium elevatio TaxID=3157996 RepID=A0ABV3DJQ2_9ACTN
MDVSAESVRARVRRAREALADAAEGQDPRAVSAALDELEGALQSARDNGVAIPAAGEDQEPGRPGPPRSGGGSDGRGRG